MKKFLTTCVALGFLSNPAVAQYYAVTPYYAPVPVYAPVVIPVPRPVPVAVPVPVVVPVRPPICSYMVDPYDLIGQVFGDPDLIQTCW